MENWIPVSSGKYPKDGEVVQVTYLSYYDKKPLCNAFAFRRDGYGFGILSKRSK